MSDGLEYSDAFYDEEAREDEEAAAAADFELHGFKEYAERLAISYPQDVLAQQAQKWLESK